MTRKQMRKSALYGIIGGLLMLFGDLCFYMTPISGADFSRIETMGAMPTNRLILGGVIGPIAGLFYVIGVYIFYTVFEFYNKRIAFTTWILFAIMFVFGGAYHSVYETYGFVPLDDTSGAADKITALINAMRAVSFVMGVTASILFIYMTLKEQTAFPKWIVVFTPTLWTLLGPIIGPYIPYPVGSVIIGGWINICFIVFFTICYFVIDENNEDLPLMTRRKKM